MIACGRLVVEAMYASWAAGDVPATMSCFAQDLVFAVHAPPNAATFLRHGRGRSAFERRIKTFLGEFEVLDYRMLSITGSGDWLHCRIFYHYRHKETRMDIDGTMRHDLRMAGDQIVQFEVIHDAERMGAFFELVARARVGA